VDSSSIHHLLLQLIVTLLFITAKTLGVGALLGAATMAMTSPYIPKLASLSLQLPLLASPNQLVN
jgi:hypothetical protein